LEEYIATSDHNFYTQLSEGDKLLKYKEEETKGLFASLLKVVGKYQLLNTRGQYNRQNNNVGNNL
jgi:hypothetical protein